MKKRIFSATAALALAIGGLTAVAAPANAWHNWQSPEKSWICSWFPYWCD